jgi:hypothetical protein
MTNEEVASCFDDPMSRTVDSCLKLLRGRKVQVRSVWLTHVKYTNRFHQHILLVGGFGESPFLQQRLRDEFGAKGSEIVTVDQPS